MQKKGSILNPNPVMILKTKLYTQGSEAVQVQVQLTYHLFISWSVIFTYYTFSIYIYTETMLHIHEMSEQNYPSFSLSPLDWHQQASQLEHRPSSDRKWAWPLSPV
jgi:hypothetical protein